MTHKLDWSTSASALATAIASAPPALAANGNQLLAQLNAAGGAYDTAYAGTGVDSAKGLWLTSTTAAWTSADLVARSIIVTTGGDDPGATAFDAYHLTALTDVTGKAKAPSPVVAGELVAVLGAVTSAWDQTAPPMPADGSPPTPVGFLPATRGACLDAPFQATGYDQHADGTTVATGWIQTADSPRHLELGVSALIDDVAAWIDAADGP